MTILFFRNLVNIFFDVLYWLILARIILSFFPVDPYRNPFLVNLINFIRQLTEPVLSPFRKIVPPVRMGAGFMDLSPILTLIVLGMIRRLILSLL